MVFNSRSHKQASKFKRCLEFKLDQVAHRKCHSNVCRTFSPQQKFVRCSVRAEVRHLRKVLCHRLNVEKHQVSRQSLLTAQTAALNGVSSDQQLSHLRNSPFRFCVISLQVQMLFNNESLPDHMTMKRLWLSHWFGKVGKYREKYTVFLFCGLYISTRINLKVPYCAKFTLSRFSDSNLCLTCK